MSYPIRTCLSSALPLDDPDSLARLTPRQQWVAVRLQSESETAVAEEMEMPLAAFRERLLNPIRRLMRLAETADG